MAFTGWGTTNFIRCPSGLITAVPLTIVAWVKVASIGVQGDIAGCYTSGSAGNRNRFALQVSASGAISAQCADGTNTSAGTTASTLTPGTWGHAAAVFASTTSRSGYLNGTGKVTETTSRVPTGINRMSMGVGDGSSAINNMQSGDLVAEVGFWNVALDDAEIAALAAAVPPQKIRPQSLIAYLPLVRDLIDLKGNAFAIQGSLSAAAHCRIYGAVA